MAAMAEEAEYRRPAADGEVAEQVATGTEAQLSLAMSLYRGEMRRTVAWRDRLDRTTNWAVVMTATLLTWAFSRTENPHYMLLVAIAVVALFTVIEARRYRHYDVWRARLRLLEQSLFANVFEPEGSEQTDWRALLSEDLRRPSYKMPWIEALQRRLRRIHGPLFLILLAAWLLRITAFSPGPLDLAEDAAVGDIPGQVTAGAVGLFTLLLAALTLWPLRRRAPGSVAEDDGEDRSWED